MTGVGRNFGIGARFASPASRIGVAALVAGVVALATAALVAMAPSTYEARVALLAQPVTQASPTGETFNGFVDLALPAVVEFVHSTSALNDIRRQVPGAPDVDDLSGAITVERSPAAAVTTIVVTASSREAAEGLTRATVAQVVAAGLLSPVAVLRPLDTRPTVRELRPNPVVLAGASLGAGGAAALALLAALQLWLPTPAARLRRSLDDAGVEQPVILIDGDDEGAPTRLASLGATVGGAARIVPVGTVDAPAAVARLHDEGGIEAVTGPTESGTPVIAVAPRDADSDDLAGAWSALPRPAALVAVVLG